MVAGPALKLYRRLLTSGIPSPAPHPYAGEGSELTMCSAPAQSEGVSELDEFDGGEGVNGPKAGDHLRRDRVVYREQHQGVAARTGTPDLHRGDVDVGLAEQ